MSLVLSRHRGTKADNFARLKRAIDSQVPYPYLVQHGLTWSEHPKTKEHYVAWDVWKKMLARHELTQKWNAMADREDLLHCDLGPFVETAEEFLAGRLR